MVSRRQDGTTLLVANDGGHVTQLYSLHPRLPVSSSQVWATIRTPQTESLLAGERVYWLHPSDPRDLKVALQNAWAAREVFRAHDISLVVSTGSSLAAAVLPVAAARGIETVYIESATRVSAPSFTGRYLRWFPGITTLTQQRHWTRRGWRYAGSIFDGYSAKTLPDPVKVTRVLVTVGTSRKYAFRRLLERLVAELPTDVEVRWQSGSTDVSGLRIEGVDGVDAETMRRWIDASDVVVSHAGTGSALMCLDRGKIPLLVPRDPRYGEHVDDHQHQIAEDLEDRGLAVVREADRVAWADLLATARLRADRVDPDPLTW